MREFILTSEKFTGSVVIRFSDSDSFTAIDFAGSEATKDQQAWFLSHLPATVLSLEIYRKNGIVCEEVKKEITFKAMWDLYDDKVTSSKKRSLAKWNKMNKTEQARAYNYVKKYFANIPSGTRKKYLETYLNSEMWNN